MNIHTLTEQSIQIITEYYKNNLQPYFNSIDEDILWIGPAKGQWLRGKSAILSTWAKENHQLTFSMNNITSSYITSHDKYCEIILTYEVSTHYPDGHTITRDQILHYTWCERTILNALGQKEKNPKILMIHISNQVHYDTRDNIYPIHLADSAIIEAPQYRGDSRLLVNGQNHLTYSIPINQIKWIESTNKGLHAVIHTETENLHVIKSISSLAKENPDCFIQIHSCYLINPLFVHSIRRFEMEMLDGSILPIPEKKYTKVKKQFADWILKWNEKKSI